MKLRHGSSVILAALCIAAGAVRAQYVEDSIDVGAGWVGGLAYNSREDVLYGRCEQAGVFFAISCDSNKVVSSQALDGPYGIIYDSLDDKGYVAFAGAGEDSLAVIDGSTHQIVKKVEMPGATIPVWDPISDRVYVSCQSTNKVAVVDCVTDSLLKYISVGACPIEMYVNTLRRKLYVLNYDDGTVSVVSMTTNQVIKTEVVGGTPNAGYYSLSADKFYSAGRSEQCVVIGGQSDTVVARIFLPGIDYVLSATGNEVAGMVYLGTFSGSADYVATVRTQDDSVLATVTVGQEPWGITFFDKSGLVYCASAITDEVSVLAGDGRQVLTTLQVGDYPYVFAAVPSHNRLYVGHLSGRHVYVLRDTSAGIAESKSQRHVFGGALSIRPNPFRRNSAVIWNTPARGGDVARAYAQDGRLVRQARIPAGEERWVWDGRDDSGATLPPGVYVLETGSGLRAKVVKLK